MIVRALIVVLCAANLAAALWWLSGGAVLPPATVDPVVPGVARLELVGIDDGDADARRLAPPMRPVSVENAEKVPNAPAPTAMDTLPGPPPVLAETKKAPSSTPLTSEHCLSFGPFAQRDAAEAALARVRALMVVGRIREVAEPGGQSYRVLLPSAGERAAAQALVQRIAAAGIDDYYILSRGADVNAIALGRYSSRERAERRRAELAAKGFAAQIRVDADTSRRWWIDTRSSVPAARLTAELRAPSLHSRACAGIR